MDMSDLEPNVLFSQRGRWHGNNVSETLQTISDGVTWAACFRLLCLPQDFADTSAVVCRLYRAESRFRWPFRNRAACA